MKQINHVGLRVSNLEATRKFYEKLGFEFIAGRSVMIFTGSILR